MNRIAIMVTVVVALLMAGMVTYDATAEATPVTYQTERTASAAAVEAHQSITSYAGPQTCVACHLTEAKSAHKSLHYQESGPTPYVPNIPGIAGKNKNAMNTYCGAISTSSYFTCSGCHVSNGQRPTSKATPAQLANVDCMMCHATTYARKAAPPYTQVSAVAEDGSSRMINVPVETASGFHFMVNEAAMGGVTALDAARSVGPTTRGTCLRCHATAGGGDGTKRGDLSSLSAAPTVQQDMHMSADTLNGGKNLSCSACHDAGNHKMTGRGLDLRENDVNEILTCAKCHSDRPHGDYNARDGESMDAHASRVACQTCHIPTFAKGKDTEMERDWTVPVWFTGAFGGQGGWKPEEIRLSNVIPTYRWFDGRSNVYNLGQRATKNADGEYQFGVPLGSVSSNGAKIYPMKEHTSIAARQVSTGRIIPHSTEVYFRTGDFTAAILEGMARAKMTGAYEIVPLHTFQTINHGVEPEENALACAACHADLSGGGEDDDDRATTVARMDLTGQLGYQLKGAESTVCTQCHDRESYEGFLDTHDKHVKDKGYDCSYCHTFSRPERGLKLPRP